MSKTTIIAEIGINHNGDLNIAKKMILEVKKSGVDLVKFQKRDIGTLYSKKYLESERESPWGKTQYDQKNGLEFNEKQYDEINKFCKKNKMEWFASPWDIPSVKFLKKYKLRYSKVASAMIVNLELLNEIAKQKKYTFISTGMCSFKDINNPGDPTIQANQQRSELTKQSGNISFKDQPSEDSDEGVLASSFRKAKEEAKLWMMGKLESGLSNLTDKDSASADTGTGVESSKANKKLGVGKIPVLGSNPQPLPTNMPNPSIPSTKIPQPSVPNMTMPRMTSPKMPKF